MNIKISPSHYNFFGSPIYSTIEIVEALSSLGTNALAFMEFSRK
jgi:hypothetical protein